MILKNVLFFLVYAAFDRNRNLDYLFFLDSLQDYDQYLEFVESQNFENPLPYYFW